MKAVLLHFDSLNRHFLSAYGCDWTHTPNFRRLAQRCVRFDRAYVGSMPCMPARREIHTGRPDLLHRGWGPLEPFDDSMPEILSRSGVYTHLVSDHYHYWEEQGANYHARYNSWEFFRGQEGDPWIGQAAEPSAPPNVNGKGRRQDWVNRQFMRHEDAQPGPRTVRAGLDFLRRNHAQDRWLLHLECFDPHEPWFAPRKYRDLYPYPYAGPLFDWPGYRPVDPAAESPALLEHARYQYAALLSMCDAHLGDVMDTMDDLDLWKDTMLIVTTDHGFMLGEDKPDARGEFRGCWAKNWQPWFDELAHIPLFIHDPRCLAPGQARCSLVQTIDLAPTLLDFFGLPATRDMLGRPLRDTIASDATVREAGLFGIFGGHVNVTDGRHIYMRAPVCPDDGLLHEYTLMPARLRNQAAIAAAARLVGPTSFSKGFPLLRYPQPGRGASAHKFGHLLFDVSSDPQQRRPLHDPAIEQRMIGLLVTLMRQCEAPAEQFDRLGLSDCAIRASV